jgi:hypothetical protein
MQSVGVADSEKCKYDERTHRQKYAYQQRYQSDLINTLELFHSAHII